MKTKTRTGEVPQDCIFISKTHHRNRSIVFFVLIVCAGLLGGTASALDIAAPGCPVFPADHVWNIRVDHLPLDPNSAAYVATIGAAKGLHPDFGSGTWDGFPIGIPYVSVPGSQPKVPVIFDWYGDESDPGPYPIPSGAPIEGDPNSDGDRHLLIVDRDNGILYELYAAHLEQDGWHAGSGAIFDLNGYALRPEGWTSADAAGLAILPGLVRYDEVEAGEITHAIRFTAPQTKKAYLWPARHYASSLTGLNYPPMGQRFRMKADYDITGFSPRVQVILTALKRYGMVLADNGASWYLSGSPDDRWDNDELHVLQSVPGSAFEAVDESSLMIRSDSGQARTSGPDTIPPRSITDLANTTFKPNHINWFWSDPADPDFNRVMVYLNNMFKVNVTKGTMYYNATGLLAGASYTIGTRTIDASGNLNATWVNRTAWTAPVSSVLSPAPTVTGVSPSSAPRGTTMSVSLTGTGFLPGAVVKLQRTGQTDIASSNVAVSGTTAITCRLAIPANAVTGTWDVVVNNSDGQQGKKTGGFTITTASPMPAPTVTSITPSSGKIGTKVGITSLIGKNFKAGAAVKLQKAGQADINATGVAVPASTKITCTFAIPANAIAGSWDVVVTNTDGQIGKKPGGFVIASISPSPVPVVTGIDPSTGRRGTTVRISGISGKYFQPGAIVKLQKAGQADISAAGVVVTSSTRITCQITIPSTAATGSWDVLIINTDGQTGKRVNGFVVRSGTSWLS